LQNFMPSVARHASTSLLMGEGLTPARGRGVDEKKVSPGFHRN